MNLSKQQSLANNEMENNNGDFDDEENFCFDLGDFSFEADGSINVVFTNFDINSPVFIYKVNLKFSTDMSSIDGSTELIATLNLQPTGILDTAITASKTKLLFTSNESAQHFCVTFRSTTTLNTTTTDTIQVWQPSQLNQNLIGSFDLNISNNEHCTLIKTLDCPSQLISLTIPKSSIAFKDLNDSKNGNPEPFYLIASYQNGTQGFIDTLAYNQFVSQAIPVSNSGLDENNYAHKKLKPSQEYILTMDQTFSGSMLAGLTNFSRLATVRSHALIKDINTCTPSYMSHLLNLYEYCMLTGYDYWDLLASTHPTLFDSLIERIEDKFSHQIQTTLQRVYFLQHNALLYSMCRRASSAANRSKPLDLLSKLILNRSMSIVSFGIQFALNIDALSSNLAMSTPNLTSLVNKSCQPGTVNTSLINLNLDLINQSSLSAQQQSSQSILSQIKFKNNLYDYFNEVLKSKQETNAQKLNLNEIIQSVLSRKSYQILVNQQLRHVFQWILDIALNLINSLVSDKQQASPQAPALLGDLWFLNEIRKGLIYIKLLIVYNSLLVQSQLAQQPPQSNYFITSSIPVLPMKSSIQKDLITELFNIYTKFVVKCFEASSTGVSLYSDEDLLEDCTKIQAETMHDTSTSNGFYFNLKYSWLGGKISHNMSKTVQIPVDFLFEEERSKRQHPLFDIVRLIKFSRSSITKQCIRCGNLTESNTQQNVQSSKVNCVYMQDACGDKCICGGLWVLSSIQ
jgi:hypothetical protein